MRRKSLWSSFGRWIGLLVGCVCLIIILFQNNNLEKQLLELNKENRQLRASVTRLHYHLAGLEARVDLGQSVQGGYSGAQTPNAGYITSTANSKWLHPEAENFLTDELPEPPPMNVNREGVFHKVFGFTGGDPRGMNFLLENGSDISEDIAEYVTLTLAARLPHSPEKWYGQLAERIEITDDFKEYTIYLKQGVKWHKPLVDLSNPKYKWLDKEHYVTAQDIKYTVDLIKNPLVLASHLRNYYDDVDEVKVIDDYTLVIRWKKKTYQSLTFTLGLYPTPKWLYSRNESGKPYSAEVAGLKFNEHWYNNRAIGCGPYSFAKWENGVNIVLKRFEDYFGPPPAIKELHYHIIRDKFQQLLNFQSGTLDIHEFSVAQYREEILNATSDSPYQNGLYSVYPITQMVYRYIGWNMEHYLFSDKRVRKAMTHAIDRDSIVRKTLYNLGEVVTGPFYPYSSSYNKDIEPLDFSLEKAKSLLAEAGWKDSDGDGILDKMINGELKKFEFPLLVYSYRPEVISWSTVLKENLYKIGIIMHLQKAEWSVMQEKMDSREFVAYTGGWGLPWESDPYQIWHSSQANITKSSNRIGFRNKKADELIEKLRSTFKREERDKLYHELHAILHEEQPYSFLYLEKSIVATQPRLKNVRFQVFRPHVETMNWYVEEVE
jgi:ABC-type transport system substrate-binding protein